MDNNHRHHIEEIAQKALVLCKCQKPPVPVELIAEKIGLKVVPFSFPDRVSGILKRNKKAIGVNNKHHPLRQRFTIAHELGHFLLWHDGNENEEDFIDDKFDRPLPIEREANLFASFLLMPKEWVEENVKKNGLNIGILAKEFKVSEQAMTIRLLELNLIK